MHTDLSLHLHTEECQKLIIAFFQCHKENPWAKYLGACNNVDGALRKCIRRERLDKRQRNLEKLSRFRNAKKDSLESSSS